MSDRESGIWPPTVKRNTQFFCKRPRYRIDGWESEERGRSLSSLFRKREREEKKSESDGREEERERE